MCKKKKKKKRKHCVYAEQPACPVETSEQPACPVETKSYTSIYSTLLTLPPPSCYWNRQQYLHAARKATHHMDVQGRKVGIAGLTNLDVGIDKHILWMQFKKSCVRFDTLFLVFTSIIDHHLNTVSQREVYDSWNASTVPATTPLICHIPDQYMGIRSLNSLLMPPNTLPVRAKAEIN